MPTDSVIWHHGEPPDVRMPSPIWTIKRFGIPSTTLLLTSIVSKAT
ncbi:hypothetical protein QC763_0058070 [Podospora pseudopauciseta]|uniref:Uncharacterized protein n=1 Tax=Podospora pseudopauciseta TaxID=2093780 RepID=A0ABR0HI00_9PEZI|nr:hypothetical protein QC763_0058070 [Podospora pseudopauciseta]